MAQTQPIQVQVDPNGYYITGVNIMQTEEEFAFFITSQNQGRQFIASPKHAKRILLLLQKVMAEHEAKYGEVKTTLPQIPSQTSERAVGFEDKK